jgi:serine protease Do
VSRQAGIVAVFAGAVSFLLGLVVAGTRFTPPSGVWPMQPVSLPSSSPLRLSTGSPQVPAVTAPGAVDFAAVVAAVNAAVVNVDTAFRGIEERPRYGRRYSTEDAGAPREGTGSGFLIDPSGFILTNYHVVSPADRITVTLADGRAFRATIVGVDPTLDVALIKVNAPAPLPTVVLGNSETLRVGEWVSAIGNPLGVYVHSVTVGVVSFLGRKLFDQGLDAYIQTDAAISVGSSGGPLINMRGEVVGITTAVVAQAINIGFAIPITQVIDVLPQLRQSGIVARGDLGVALTTITPGLRRALGLEPKAGALVEDVLPDTPAERAGLRAYDVITSIDGRVITSDWQLVRDIARRLPGTNATLEVWRDGHLMRSHVKLSVRKISDPSRWAGGRSTDARHAAQIQAPLGIGVRDLDPSTAEYLRIPDMIQGVLVTEVDPAGPARLAQVRGNQVILEVNRQPVRSAAQYHAAVADLAAGDTAALLVYDRASSQRVICQVVLDGTP